MLANVCIYKRYVWTVLIDEVHSVIYNLAYLNASGISIKISRHAHMAVLKRLAAIHCATLQLSRDLHFISRWPHSLTLVHQEVWLSGDETIATLGTCVNDLTHTCY